MANEIEHFLSVARKGYLLPRLSLRPAHSAAELSLRLEGTSWFKDGSDPSLSLLSFVDASTVVGAAPGNGTWLTINSQTVIARWKSEYVISFDAGWDEATVHRRGGQFKIRRSR